MPGIITRGRTLYDKLFEDHVVHDDGNGSILLYIDRHMVHEVSSPQAFEGLRNAGRRVRRPECVLATTDHNTPTSSRSDFTDVSSFIRDPESRLQCETLERNVNEFGITYFGLADKRQGIVHVVGPEQGFTLPGTTVVCGDSHTSTHGAFGCLAFGIGSTEVEHVLATQTLLVQSRSKNMKISIDGDLVPGVTSKDVVLHIIGLIGTAGAVGHVIEFCGSTIERLDMAARMTVCNMSIEAGARAGLIAPDEETFRYLANRPFAPGAGQDQWRVALEHWRELLSDEHAHWDKEVFIKAADVAPSVTWGTSPEQVVPIDGRVPSPDDFNGEQAKRQCQYALQYMDLVPGTLMSSIQIDKVFIGSCTNSRIEDFRIVANIVQGKRIAPKLTAIIVPGSGLVKQQMQAEGLDKILQAAGFDVRESGCSMCVGLNEDILLPGERCASTTNRNFEGRQGSGGRTHLVSPALAAATALRGQLADIRSIEGYTELWQKAIKKKRPPVEIATDMNSLGTSAASLPLSASKQDSNVPETTNASSMQAFTTLRGTAAVMRRSNIDTDVILPKQFCKTVTRSGLAKGLFYDWRFSSSGQKRPEFVLNQPPFDQAKILISYDNFGCGSSREHAPWALLDFGIRCVIAPSYGEIFYNNAFKNMILPIIISESEVLEDLMDRAEAGEQLEVDLRTCSIRDGNNKQITTFFVEEYRRLCLLDAVDDIAKTLQKEAHITAFEQRMAERRPWLLGPCHDQPAQAQVHYDSRPLNRSIPAW